MKTPIQFGAVILSLLAIGFLVFPSRAQTSTSRPRWEYKVESVDYADEGSRDRMLGNLGDQGWELAGISDFRAGNGAAQTVLYFKRLK